jgi:hypothetical protein
VNLEDQSAELELDPLVPRIVHRWSLAPCVEPSGLAIDREHRRLFAGCHNRMMAVIDADSGKVIATPAIGAGVDANAFDAATQFAFSANGDGTLTIVREEAPDDFRVTENVKTKPGARTMALDEKTHNVYLVAADFGSSPAPRSERPHPRPPILADSFVVLVYGIGASPAQGDPAPPSRFASSSPHAWRGFPVIWKRPGPGGRGQTPGAAAFPPPMGRGMKGRENARCPRPPSRALKHRWVGFDNEGMGQVTEQSVKGSLMLGVVVMVRRHRKQGLISAEQLAARLSQGALHMLEEKVDIGRWYPIQVFNELLDLDWDVGGRRDPNYMRQEGEQAAERLFRTGIYQQLHYAERVERVRAREALIRQARLITTITGTLYNFLDFKVRLDEDNLEVHYGNAAAFSEALRFTTEGFMNQINKRQRSSAQWSSKRVQPDLVVFALPLPQRLRSES